MTFVSRTQFHFERPWGQRPFRIVVESGSSCFQLGEGPSRGLLCDYESSDGPSFQALLTANTEHRRHAHQQRQTINKSYNVHQSLGSGHHWARLARRGTAACTWAGSARLQTNAWLAEFRIFSTMRLVRKATISHYQLPVSHPTNYLGLQPIKRRQASHRAAGYMITPYYAFNFQYLQFRTTIKQIFVQY